MAAPYDPIKGNRLPFHPAQMAFPITPTDNQPLPGAVSAIYVGGAGNVTVYFRDEPYLGTSKITGLQCQPVTYVNVPAGTWIRGCISIVMATGTTATNLIGEI